MRTRLVADLEKAHVSNETERLRSALLSSVSHDLRSPLAAMIGSADSLSSYAEAMDASDRRALLDTILVEGERLDRYIQNLLDMTRLGHEGLQINRDWIGVDELVGSAARRLQRYQPDVRLQLDIPSTLGPIWVHPALVEQAVFNVMENAAKFSRPARRWTSRRGWWTANCASTCSTPALAFPMTNARASSTCSTAWSAATVAGMAPGWA